ncbi:serine hydrolase domain-containing protein [Streptomyces sp. NPDC006733]|uniref:serine hydrolase domain-containing protein n=1 Tax=Streptomyces sp. NPDC006733 TaxID=3155460 RepID=UPI003400BD53
MLSSSAPPVVRGGHGLDRFVEIGSFTKVLTGTALARMAAAGLLGLDDPVERWLGRVPAGTGITLRHLAAHTSGLPRLPPGLARKDPYAAFDQEALSALLDQLGSLTATPPGQSEEYSNFGYAVLGAALVAAARAPYAQLVEEHVLAPLGVHEVTAQPPADRRLCARRWGRERAPWTMSGAILPAGGMWATPRAAADLLTRLLLDRVLGPPALSWQASGPLIWHNGATRDASVFAGAVPATGRWVVVHRLGGSPAGTENAAVAQLRRAEDAG